MTRTRPTALALLCVGALAGAVTPAVAQDDTLADAVHATVATGSVALPIPGTEFGGRILDTWGAWSLPELPASMAVVGAGASGSEIASAYARFGTEVTLLTHLIVREDAHQLYGFATEAERAAFRQLLRISGVGARTALAVLSGMSVADLRQTVSAQDASRLTKIPGIGKKTAERLLLELRDKLELGGAWGQFKGEPVLKIWSAYRFADTLSVEGTIGQVQGAFSGTEFWHVNLNVEPWSDRRLSPFFGIGLGQFKNIPNASLVDAFITKANLANAALGLRYHIAERFVARLDYAIYTAYVADSDTAEYKAVTLGLAFFF